MFGKICVIAIDLGILFGIINCIIFFINKKKINNKYLILVILFVTIWSFIGSCIYNYGMYVEYEKSIEEYIKDFILKILPCIIQMCIFIRLIRGIRKERRREN